MIKSSAGILACAIAALVLTATSAHAQPVDSEQEQYITAGSGPSSQRGPSSDSGGSGSGSIAGGGSLAGDDAEEEAPTTISTQETFTPTEPTQPPADTTTPTTEPPPATSTTTTSTDPATTTTTTSTNPSTTTTTATTTDPLAELIAPIEPAAPSTAAGPRFLVRVRAGVFDDVMTRHRLTPIAIVHQTTATDPAMVERLVLIAGPDGTSADAIDAEMDSDPDILGCEQDKSLALPEVASSGTPPSTNEITQSLATQTVTSFYGVEAPSTYVSQPAATIINLPLVRALYTGAGVVAVIDTGVDSTHPMLTGSVLAGYDFTREQAGTATDMLDIEQSTAAILEQSTAAILEQNQVVVVNQSTAAILEQSTAAILEGQPPLPAAFGHGTMVAGLIHLTAPAASILPLKAFTAAGTSSIANVVRAIYYAVDSGARVINMSFSVAESSPELVKAINYATSHRVTCVAAAGNLGIETIVYPAAYKNVIAVAATTNTDTRSAFSNFGDADVTLAAPGEGVTTTFPGRHYASVSGTSFSAAFVSGAVSLLLQETTLLTPRDAAEHFTHSARTTPRLGYGRLDVQRALDDK